MLIKILTVILALWGPIIAAINNTRGTEQLSQRFTLIAINSNHPAVHEQPINAFISSLAIGQVTYGCCRIGYGTFIVPCPDQTPTVLHFGADYVYMSEEHKRMLFISTTDHFWTKNRLGYDYQDQLPATFAVNGFNLADGELKFPGRSFYACPVFHYYRIFSIALPDSGPLESCISIVIKIIPYNGPTPAVARYV
jgi:hypothetical protein